MGEGPGSLDGCCYSYRAHAKFPAWKVPTKARLQNSVANLWQRQNHILWAIGMHCTSTILLSPPRSPVLCLELQQP